ncbi:MAG: hypothetical protein FRX49_11017 [Trebouxia sp. A1-2]|nr:MAG: hypothetical protein FRX49_11017 [Trebouxia sp. A1-2]
MALHKVALTSGVNTEAQGEQELYGGGLTDKPALLMADKVSEAATAAKHLARNDNTAHCSVTRSN